MEKKEYNKIVKKHKAKENRKENAIIAFLIGGTIGAIAELFIQLYSYYLDIPTKDAQTFMIVTLIFIATLFTGLG